MRTVLRLLSVSLLVVTACGQVEPVLLPVSMPECIAQGPDSMREGSVSVSLTVNGLGEARVDLLELTGGHSYEDLTDAVAVQGQVPEWAIGVLSLELGPSEGVDGVSDEVRLDEGEYAIACLDDAGVRIARSLLVKPA